MFDFGKAKGDPRLLLVASLAINTYLMRWVRKDPHKKKFFHVDELQVVSEYPLIRKAIDQAVRTVRKENVHCIVGSQDPRDFEGEEFHSIRINCEVMWLFQMPAELARSVFNVPVGIANLIANLNNGRDEFRECALVYPGGCPRLRLRFGPVDGRLFMEASTGNEKFSAIDAISAVPGPVPERLWNALQISRDAAEVPLNEVWKIA
jgi:type IV secretory pathway VirB4 component